MKKKLIAIGGGENGRILENGIYAPYETETIDEEIVRLANKKNPNFLFIDHAMDSVKIQDNYYDTMKKIYGEKFLCNCKDLKSSELYDIKTVKEKIQWADIIYEGGGNTENMIKLWKDTSFDELLYKAWIDGKVICGISAGAVCWFKSCNSYDELTNKFIMLDCLGWINIHMTPHCDELGRKESTKNQLKESNLVGISLSNCAALEIIDDEYRLIVSNSNNKKGFGIKSYWHKGKYIEEKIVVSNKFEKITYLLDIK